MKKIGILCLALILALSVLPAAQGEKDEFSFRSDGRLSGYSGSGGTVTVPAEHGGEPVRSLYRNAFKGNKNITEIVLESGLQSLGEAACYSMTALEKASLPDTLAAIDEANFTDCRSLEEITLPASLKYVGDNCFGWCPKLQAVTFLGPVPTFGGECFLNHAPELVIYVPDDQLEAYRGVLPEGLDIRPSGANAQLSAAENDPGDFSFDASTGTLTAYSGKDAYVAVPKTMQGVPVLHIGDYAFESNNFTYAVSFPEGVETIGYKAFYSAYVLGRVDLPDTVKRIEESAFSGFKTANFHWPQGLQAIGQNAFSYSSMGDALYLPPNVQSIGEGAFYSSGFKAVYFPASLESVGKEAFADSKITALHFDGAVPKMDRSALAGLKIGKVTVGYQASPEDAQAVQAALKSFGLSAQVQRLQYPAQDDGPGAAVTYQDGLVTGSRGKLTAIRPLEEAEGKQVVGVSDGAFRDDKNLTGFIAPDNGAFAQIGAEAFADSALQTIDLGGAIQSIGEGAFRGSALTEICLPETLGNIGENAFADCAELESIYLLCDPAIVPASAFSGCQNVRLLRTGDNDGSDSVGLASSLGLVIPGLTGEVQPAEAATEAPAPQATEEPIAETPTPQATEEPIAEPAETAAPAPDGNSEEKQDVLVPTEEDMERFGGVWTLYQVLMGEYTYSAADTNWHMTFQLNGDGTFVFESFDEVDSGVWAAWEDYLYMSFADSEAMYLLEDGFLKVGDEELMLVFARENSESPVPIPENTDEPDAVEPLEPIPATEEEMERFGGTWYLHHVIMDNYSYSASEMNLEITLQLNADGTASLQSVDEVEEGIWVAWDNYVYIASAESEAVYTLEDGFLTVGDEELTMALSRTKDSTAAFTMPQEAPSATLADFEGTWQAKYLVTEEMTLPADSPMLDEIWQMFFNSDDRTLLIKDGQVTRFGTETAYEFQDGRLIHVEDGIWDETILLLEDGGIAFDWGGVVIYCTPLDREDAPLTAVETPVPPMETPAPEEIQDTPETAAVRMDEKYVCVSAETEGHQLEASVLGGEYAITFHADGTADFVMSNVPISGLPWKMDGGDVVVDYYGARELRFTHEEDHLIMDFFGSMLLRMEIAE